jgi:hypothetical protein
MLGVESNERIEIGDWNFSSVSKVSPFFKVGKFARDSFAINSVSPLPRRQVLSSTSSVLFIKIVADIFISVNFYFLLPTSLHFQLIYSYSLLNLCLQIEFLTRCLVKGTLFEVRQASFFWCVCFCLVRPF